MGGSRGRRRRAEVVLMTLLMIVGGVALLYAVFRIGRWKGRSGD